MSRYAKESRHSPNQIIEEALELFGPEGLGLEVVQEGEGCATFLGGGGHISIRVCKAHAGSEVEMETREWDYHVQKFLGAI
jgi:hypothetical protein